MNLNKNIILSPSVSLHTQFFHLLTLSCLLGAKKCATIRALMNERRFTLDLDHLERLLTLEEFMLYCYKTSFCPLIN